MVASGTAIVSTSDEYTLATVGSVAVMIWRTQVTVDNVRSLHDTVNRLAREVRGKVGMLSIALADCAQPSAEARAEMGEGPRRMGSVLAAVSVVYAATGFKGAAVRAMLSTIQLANRALRRPVPEKLFADVDPAARWLAPQVGHDPSQLASAALSLVGE